MRITPHQSLQHHINHYWIEKDAGEVFGRIKMNAYPGITPELLIVLDGSFEYSYEGEKYLVDAGCFFAFIHDKVIFESEDLKSFVLIQFQSRGISSILPFMTTTAIEIMKEPVFAFDKLGGDAHLVLDKLRKSNRSEKEISSLLNEFFLSRYDIDRVGVLAGITQSLQQHQNLKEIIEQSPYSESTFLRHFKRETGLTPKLFQSLQRYKRVAQEICETKNNDWMYYIEKYQYFDQSHFIREIKRFTSFTPSQLLKEPSLLDYRKLDI